MTEFHENDAHYSESEFSNSYQNWEYDITFASAFYISLYSGSVLMNNDLSELTSIILCHS